MSNNDNRRAYKGVAKMIYSAFTFDFSGVKSAISEMGEDMKNAVLDVVKPWDGIGDRMSKGYQKGVDKNNFGFKT